MLRYAVCNDQNKVINVILWDGITPWQKPANTTLIKHDECNITNTYDSGNNTFIPMPEKSLPQGIL